MYIALSVLYGLSRLESAYLFIFCGGVKSILPSVCFLVYIVLSVLTGLYCLECAYLGARSSVYCLEFAFCFISSCM